MLLLTNICLSFVGNRILCHFFPRQSIFFHSLKLFMLYCATLRWNNISRGAIYLVRIFTARYLHCLLYTWTPGHFFPGSAPDLSPSTGGSARTDANLAGIAGGGSRRGGAGVLVASRFTYVGSLGLLPRWRCSDRSGQIWALGFSFLLLWLRWSEQSAVERASSPLNNSAACCFPSLAVPLLCLLPPAGRGDEERKRPWREWFFFGDCARHREVASVDLRFFSSSSDLPMWRGDEVQDGESDGLLPPIQA
jgi:hypothetical protein